MLKFLNARGTFMKNIKHTLLKTVGLLAVVVAASSVAQACYHQTVTCVPAH